MPTNYCPECGSELSLDSISKRFACKSCGLFVTREELSDIREKNRESNDEQRNKNREKGDYLDWWLSTKKK